MNSSFFVIVFYIILINTINVQSINQKGFLSDISSIGSSAINLLSDGASSIESGVNSADDAVSTILSDVESILSYVEQKTISLLDTMFNCDPNDDLYIHLSKIINQDIYCGLEYFMGLFGINIPVHSSMKGKTFDPTLYNSQAILSLDNKFSQIKQQQRPALFSSLTKVESKIGKLTMLTVAKPTMSSIFKSKMDKLKQSLINIQNKIIQSDNSASVSLMEVNNKQVTTSSKICLDDMFGTMLFNSIYNLGSLIKGVGGEASVVGAIIGGLAVTFGTLINTDMIVTYNNNCPISGSSQTTT